MHANCMQSEKHEYSASHSGSLHIDSVIAYINFTIHFRISAILGQFQLCGTQEDFMLPSTGLRNDDARSHCCKLRNEFGC